MTLLLMHSKLESWFVVLFSGAKQKISLEKGKKFSIMETVIRKKPLILI
jgi:hypothetical protein